MDSKLKCKQVRLFSIVACDWKGSNDPWIDNWDEGFHCKSEGGKLKE